MLTKRSVLAFAALLLPSLLFSSGPRADEIKGVSFTGGDGSFTRAVEGGITIGISDDLPFTYLDPKTKAYQGIDVAILSEAASRLGIKSVKFELVQFDALIPGLISKRWDVVGDNIHENPKRLEVINFTGPVYWYGTSLTVPKGNPANLHTWESLAGHTVGPSGAASRTASLPRARIWAR